ncbi:DUF2505 domain-containing protein [Actinokineospora auranticolor]|uniref:Uncharacterized protein DUF2505 n=1 Tax=Actinokineospora auranticolor TaxID=155976 RepID=A0A2S6GHE5_9PSEU|nr:DUF2505 domain-containing protein [Actinokineospora auranticolor]PPK64566.1 uncharacterized protein DUF2505 [Actinokineospora auranticolor]
MASRIEHRASFRAPAATVHARLVDQAFLRDRLRTLGGTDAALVEHKANGDGVAYKLRQGIESALLPSIVRTLVKGDLVVERLETWRPDGAGFAGTTSATVAGIPGEIRGTYRLVDVADGSELRTDAEVKVRVPLVGGKIESVIAEQVRKLLASEAAFAAEH